VGKFFPPLNGWRNRRNKMADTATQVDYDALSKDATFKAMPLQQQRDYLSAVDKDFAAMDPETQKGYVAHITGANLATPFAQAAATKPESQLRLRSDLNLPPTASTPEVSNAYSGESGKFIGATAGAMVGGTAPTMALRALATGVGSGVGAAAGGATPKEAAITGVAGTVLQPAAELATSALSLAGKKLLAPAVEKLGGWWDNVTGYTQALEEAKNANYARYLAAEQKAGQAVAEGQANVAAVKAAQPQGQLGNWSDLNQSIGTSAAKAIRIGKGSADISSAYGIPGRGLEAEGFTTESLQKMTPPEQASAIGPRFQAAGKAVQATADKATEAGTTFDAGKSVFNVIKNRIPDPSLQEKAIEIINSHQQELGIDNIRQATPTQGLALRQALKNDANFGLNATTDSLKGVGRAIYNAVSSDLHDAVPGMKTVDMHYGDLAQAVDTVRQNTGKYMAGKWTPPQTAVQKAEAAIPELPKSSPYTPLPSNDVYSSALRRKIAGGAGVGGAMIGGGYGALEAIRRLLQPSP
jgi:hypothetical protein